MSDIIDLVSPLLSILMVFGVPGLLIFWVLYTKHRERMRLIEKGLSPEELKNYFAKEEKIKTPYRGLKWAIILLSLGVGILVSNILYDKYNLSDGYTFGFVMFFLGAGFLMYYLIIRNKDKQSFKEEKK